MSKSQSVRDLDRDRECALYFQRPSGDQLANVLTLDVLHRDVKNAICIVKVIDRADIRMIELRTELRFALEPLKVRSLLSKLRRQYFDHHRAVQLGIERLVNRTLTARAYLFENFILID